MKLPFQAIYVVFGLLLLNVSCTETSEENSVDIATVQDTKTRYGKSLSALPQVSEIAKVETATWSVFEDFETNVSSMNNQTVPALKTKCERLSRQSDSLLKKIPTTLHTQPVFARLVLANTRAQLLHQQVHYDKIDSLQLEQSLQEMNQAAAYLFIEINRTFKKNKIDESLKETEKMELEKQKRFLDSVYRSEIQDNIKSGM